MRASASVTDEIAIIPAADLGDLTRLEPLARAIFGEGDRAPGWFERKLHRECVDAELSRLAVSGGQLHDPDAWVGYALVGTPASIHPAVRTAGIGVVPDRRSTGIGARLLEAIADACASAGYRSVRTPVEPARRAFYRRQGFAPRRGLCTVLSHGRGPEVPAPAGPDRSTAAPQDPAQPWDPWRAETGELVELFGWIPEAWARTPGSQCRTLMADSDSGDVAVHFSREGLAWVGHRLVVRDHAPIDMDSIADAVDALLDRFGAGVPVLLTALDPVSSITSALLHRGWSIVQRADLMERPL
jgi:GNAT superfamily N-acetyltransferase